MRFSTANRKLHSHRSDCSATFSSFGCLKFSLVSSPSFDVTSSSVRLQHRRVALPPPPQTPMSLPHRRARCSSKKALMLKSCAKSSSYFSIGKLWANAFATIERRFIASSHRMATLKRISFLRQLSMVCSKKRRLHKTNRLISPFSDYALIVKIHLLQRDYESALKVAIDQPKPILLVKYAKEFFAHTPFEFVDALMRSAKKPPPQYVILAFVGYSKSQKYVSKPKKFCK